MNVINYGKLWENKSFFILFSTKNDPIRFILFLDYMIKTKHQYQKSHSMLNSTLLSKT